MIPHKSRAGGWHHCAIMRRGTKGKKFSHFPQVLARLGGGIGAERVIKLEPQEMVGVEMRHPNRLSLDHPIRGFQSRSGPNGSTRNLQRKIGRASCGKSVDL